MSVRWRVWSVAALVCVAGMIHGGCLRSQGGGETVVVDAEVVEAPPSPASGEPEAEPQDRGMQREQVSAAKRWFNCALRVDGTVWCWGSGVYGKLGNGERAPSTVPVQVLGLDDAVSVDSGWNHSCAVREGGRVACWGMNSDGQLGDWEEGRLPSWRHDTVEYSLEPVEVLGLDDAVAVSAGWDETCAVREGGQVVCWGTTLWAPDSGRSGFVEVVGLQDAVQVSAGYSYVCALRRSGQVVCWGSGTYGVLGHGEETWSDEPVDVSGLSDAVWVSAGESHTCAARATGQVVCWGMFGQTQVAQPVAVEGIDDAVTVSVGLTHNCALRDGGTVVCWGSNHVGQLGHGGEETEAGPVEVEGLRDVVSMSVGDRHTCALLEGGDVVCWGRGESGELGHGRFEDSATPVAVEFAP